MRIPSLNEAFPSLLWIALFLFILLKLNIPALRRYGLQKKHADLSGHTGLKLLANNQMVRYWARFVEDIAAIALGILGVVALFYPVVARSALYGFAVVVFFFLTGIITGWLTYRDLKVLDQIEKMDTL